MKSTDQEPANFLSASYGINKNILIAAGAGTPTSAAAAAAKLVKSITPQSLKSARTVNNVMIPAGIGNPHTIPLLTSYHLSMGRFPAVVLE